MSTEQKPTSLILVTVAVATLYSASCSDMMGNTARSSEYSERLHFGEGQDRVFWSPDGSKLAGIDLSNGMVQIWDAATGDWITGLDEAHVYSAAWSPDGSKVASNTTSHTIMIWSTETGKIVDTITGVADESESPLLLMNDVSWSPTGSRVVSAHGIDVAIWDVGGSGEVLLLRGHTAEVTAVNWSPDGTRIASLGNEEGEVYIWDAESGELLVAVEGHGAVDWSPDSTQVGTINEGNILIWDARTGELIRVFDDRGDGAFALAWNPNGSNMAAIAAEVVEVWDVESNVTLASIEDQESDRHAISWNPDGTRLATIGERGVIYVWAFKER